MPEFRAGNAEQVAFRDALIDSGHLVATGVDGVFGHGAEFERVRLALDALVTRAAAQDEPEQISFPPVLPRRQLEDNGYLGSFPHLAGTIFAFDGDEEQANAQLQTAAQHEDWSGFQEMTDVVVMPAACYPLYPAVAARGPLPEGGLTLDTADAYVFRREPSSDPARMQIFHMREIVRIASQEDVSEWRAGWHDRALELLRSLDLEMESDVANDPFFGRAGRMLARSQRAQELKFELLADVAGNPTAIASCNYHQDHFGQTYSLDLPDGTKAHTGCMAFGEERILLALFSAHGLDTQAWPDGARTELAL